jgi:hypothetical protein
MIISSFGWLSDSFRESNQGTGNVPSGPPGELRRAWRDLEQDEAHGSPSGWKYQAATTATTAKASNHA